jgi:hypothetical protein
VFVNGKLAVDLGGLHGQFDLYDSVAATAHVADGTAIVVTDLQ